MPHHPAHSAWRKPRDSEREASSSGLQVGYWPLPTHSCSVTSPRLSSWGFGPKLTQLRPSSGPGRRCKPIGHRGQRGERLLQSFPWKRLGTRGQAKGLGVGMELATAESWGWPGAWWWGLRIGKFRAWGRALRSRGRTRKQKGESRLVPRKKKKKKREQNSWNER